MRYQYTQKQIIALLKSNPLGIDVFFNESNPGQKKAYIFLDGLQDRPIARDNDAFFVNNVQIQVYAKDIDDLNETLVYLKKHFVMSFDKYKENHFNVAAGTVDLIISDWNG